ncbi:hypothetical protein, partial [Variovorax sp. Varisp62]|uniref:hypothetical protein n=1 Tax=Variovorax sp. Varisp62 TaxID=3243049 RepID=UPI0039B5721D
MNWAEPYHRKDRLGLSRRTPAGTRVCRHRGTPKLRRMKLFSKRACLAALGLGAALLAVACGG